MLFLLQPNAALFAAIDEWKLLHWKCSIVWNALVGLCLVYSSCRIILCHFFSGIPENVYLKHGNVLFCQNSIVSCKWIAKYNNFVNSQAQ